jgi:hypothetical protein
LLLLLLQVNASVDVYAFGVMMWELFVGQRPYGNMSQQMVVEEVVLRGLRPSFPVGTPLAYTQLACSCWHATAGQRPSFQEVVGRLQVRAQHHLYGVFAAASVYVQGVGSAWVSVVVRVESTRLFFGCGLHTPGGGGPCMLSVLRCLALCALQTQHPRVRDSC